ncbi:hypothetical protein L6164_037601 [Bauhinia variegata]|uniref:Uncharacterized protein n=1 Tax=Bauhinia variegata TaxID=167791 RepID=A0ACB9KKI3_BAUVA|nr:hypothetical protein L6164_037601 [Bauhinia variegata]
MNEGSVKFPFMPIRSRSILAQWRSSKLRFARGVLALVFTSVLLSGFMKESLHQRIISPSERAGISGYTYLLEPLWWAGMVTMITGEVANFVVYIYAAAVLVTPLGTLSITVSAVLGHFLLNEKLQKMGVHCGISCYCDSDTSKAYSKFWPLNQVLDFNFYLYLTCKLHKFSGLLICVPFCFPSTEFLVFAVLALILHFEPRYGQTNMLIYLASHSSRALKFIILALDTFNAAIVSPVYYVMFTTLTIIASAIMFEDWSGQDMRSIASEICGFITVLSGTTLLHATRDQEQADMQGRLLLIRMLGSYPFVTILVLLSIGTKSEVKFYFRYRTLTWYIGDDSTKGPEDEH